MAFKLRSQCNTPLKQEKTKGKKASFEEWYKTVPATKNDTTSYNLRRAYELAPKKELDDFVKNPETHLLTSYPNKEGSYEFMKSKDHPTVQKELDWFNSNDSEAKQFKKNYNLETSGKYYKYTPKTNTTKLK